MSVNQNEAKNIITEDMLDDIIKGVPTIETVNKTFQILNYFSEVYQAGLKYRGSTSLYLADKCCFGSPSTNNKIYKIFYNKENDYQRCFNISIYSKYYKELISYLENYKLKLNPMETSNAYYKNQEMRIEINSYEIIICCEILLYPLEKITVITMDVYAEYVPEINDYSFQIVDCDSTLLTMKRAFNTIIYSEEKHSKFEKYPRELSYDLKMKFLLRGYKCFSNKLLEYNTYTLPNDMEENCTICMEEIKGECYKTTCSHYFHFDCIKSFLTRYYSTTMRKIVFGISNTLIHDIHGNVISGAQYEYSCPNCKSECFKLNVEKVNSEYVITNPENCIFKKENIKRYPNPNMNTRINPKRSLMKEGELLRASLIWLQSKTKKSN